MNALAEIVVDIPIEDQAADKALEVALFYEGRGWVARDSYTWVLYARSNMSYQLLQSFRQDIIVAAQKFKRAHGLDENLFALIVELARVGVIWRPSPPTPELRGETAWLWKEMGLAAIRDRALAAAGVALREEAESVRARVALLDSIAWLPGKIVMGSHAAALAAAKKSIEQYLSERNKAVKLAYETYPQLSEAGKTLASTVMDRAHENDRVIREGLETVGMTLADFGTPLPALTLGAGLGVAISTTVVIVVLATLVAYIASIIGSYLSAQRALETERIEAAKDAKEKALLAVETDRRTKILALSRDLSPEERARAVAEIDAWAAGENARIAREHKIPSVGLPWALIVGTAAATPVVVYGAGRAFGWIKKKPKPPPTAVHRKRGPKTGFTKFWKQSKPYFFGVGGAAAAVGLLGVSALFLKWTMLPSAPASRAPQLPEPAEPYESQF